MSPHRDRSSGDAWGRPGGGAVRLRLERKVSGESSDSRCLLHLLHPAPVAETRAADASRLMSGTAATGTPCSPTRSVVHRQVHATAAPTGTDLTGLNLAEAVAAPQQRVANFFTCDDGGRQCPGCNGEQDVDGRDRYGDWVWTDCRDHGPHWREQRRWPSCRLRDAVAPHRRGRCWAVGLHECQYDAWGRLVPPTRGRTARPLPGDSTG